MQTIVGQRTYFHLDFICGCKQSPNWEARKLGTSFNDLHKKIINIFSKSCVYFIVEFGMNSQEVIK